MSFEDHALASLWAQKPALMGVVNVTPDSFSDGGKYTNPDKAIEHALGLIHEGADIIDIGGESTRPGAQEIDSKEEIARVVPVIEGLKGKVKWLSIDTRHSQTMEAALKAGVSIINDISALEGDTRSLDVAAEAQVPVILMHKQGSPETMQKSPNYNNVVEEIFEYLQQRINNCETHCIENTMVVADPGIGFGKTLEDNLLILRNIRRFQDLGVPMMVGVSRKSFVGKLSKNEPPNERIPGSLSAALWCLSQGVQIYRVHDVAQTRQAFKIFQEISSIAS